MRPELGRLREQRDIKREVSKSYLLVWTNILPLRMFYDMTHFLSSNYCFY